MFRLFTITIGILLFISCAEFEKTLQSGWTIQMEGLASSYSQLLPYMYSEKKYSSEKNEKAIEEILQNIVEDSNKIPEHIGDKISGYDPFFRASLKGLRKTTQSSLKHFQSGRYQYSQQLAQASMNYCFKCHTNIKRGPEFVEWKNFHLPKDAGPVEKSQILIATRQFKLAEEVLHDFFLSSLNTNRPELIKALKLQLIVSLKYKSDPAEALAKIKRLEKNRHYHKLQSSDRKLIGQWKNSLEIWVDGLGKNQDLTVKGLLAKAPQLTSDGDPVLVSTIRKTQVLHRGLQKEKLFNQRAQIYYRLGALYQSQPELGLWELPNLYYETCIKSQPHSAVSRLCYERLESNVKSGYQNQEQTELPRNERDYLFRLKGLTTKYLIPGIPKSQ